MTVRVAGHEIIASGSVIVWGGAPVEFIHQDNGHELVQRVQFTRDARKPSNTVDTEFVDDYHLELSLVNFPEEPSWVDTGEPTLCGTLNDRDFYLSVGVEVQPHMGVRVLHYVFCVGVQRAIASGTCHAGR